MSDKKDDAIQEDPAIQEDAGGADASETVVDPRQEAYDALVKRHEESLGQDLEAGEPEPGTEPDQPAAEPKKEKAAEPQAQDPGDMVEIVVHGKKSKVTKAKALEEGIRALQKESAAAASLQEAKTILEEVKRLREELNSKPAVTPAPDEDAEGEMSNEDLLYAIRYGEHDEAEKAIEALKGKGRTVTPDAIDRAVEERLAAQTGQTILERLNKPAEEGGYADIMLDPLLKQHAGLKVEELVKKGEGSYNDPETYQKAAAWVRKTILGKETVTLPAESSPADEKRARKQRMTVIQPASSTEVDTSKTEEPVDPDTARRQVIADMREERNAGRF